MSVAGYYRIKVLADSDKSYTFIKNGLAVSQKTVTPIDECTGYRLLKFLCKDGQYRFYPFNKFYQENKSIKRIGSVNKFISNIYNDMSDTQNVGVNSSNQLLLSTDATNSQISVLNELIDSPRIYLYIGSENSDENKDWLEVTIKDNTFTTRSRKANTIPFDIAVDLPKNFTIKMI